MEKVKREPEFICHPNKSVTAWGLHDRTKQVVCKVENPINQKMRGRGGLWEVRAKIRREKLLPFN